jgi:hypothetical protein
MTTCEFAAIGWVITLFGFFITNRQANHRQTRQEIRSKLDQLNNALGALLDSSKNYYLDKNALLSSEIVKIHEAINTCERHIEELSHMKRGVELQPEFYILYDAVTGGDFESKNHQPGDHHAELCIQNSIQKESLVTKSEGWFRNTFQ